MYDGGGRRQRTCCCGSCCTLLMSLGFMVLIYWAIFQPHQIRATVDGVELFSFAVSNATVSYSVSANLSLYNPSKRVGIYYDTLDARLLYRGDLLGAAPASPSEFYQRGKAAQIVGLKVDGGEGGGGALPAGLAAQLQSKLGAAQWLGLEIDLALRVRYKFGGVKIRQRPRVWCALSVPVPSRCSVKY